MRNVAEAQRDLYRRQAEAAASPEDATWAAFAASLLAGPGASADTLIEARTWLLLAAAQGRDWAAERARMLDRTMPEALIAESDRRVALFVARPVARD